MPASAAPAVSISEEAVAILRATQDGDLLDPSDLSLIQDVINQGADYLSPAGQDYWKKLVTSTASGHYVKRWFCGVENLTRNGEGYVFWKGQRVEHFSYSPAQRDEMMTAARRLAAVCLKIESDGQVPSYTTIDEVWRKMDFAQLSPSIEAPRHLVVWVVLKEGPHIAVLPVHSQNYHDAKAEVDRALIDKSAQWPGACLPRTFLVVTQEDLSTTFECIERDVAWAQRQFWPAYRSSDVLDDMTRVVFNAIPRGSLIKRAEVERIMFDGLVEQVTKASEAHLSADPLQAERLDPPVERGERVSG